MLCLQQRTQEIRDYLMKSPKKRNFEADILTDDPEMLEAAIEQFDNVWIGKFCKDCGRRDYCSDPIK